jgi:hypothetical protein
MKINLYCKIKDVSKKKTNIAPVKIGNKVVGEVVKIISEQGSGVYFVEALIYDNHKEFVLSEMAKERMKLCSK